MKAHKARIGQWVYLTILFEDDIRKGYSIGDAVRILRKGGGTRSRSFISDCGHIFLYKQVKASYKKSLKNPRLKP